MEDVIVPLQDHRGEAVCWMEDVIVPLQDHIGEAVCWMEDVVVHLQPNNRKKVSNRLPVDKWFWFYPFDISVA